jgi:hypothetical protein
MAADGNGVEVFMARDILYACNGACGDEQQYVDDVDVNDDGEYVDDGATAATPNRNVNRGEDAEVIIDDRRAMIDIDIVVIEVRVRLSKLISYTSNIQSCIIHEFSITVYSTVQQHINTSIAKPRKMKE